MHSDNIERKLLELSKEVQRLQSLLLEEKNDFQPPQGDYSVLFSASQNSLKSKASENSYFNESTDMHEINDLLLKVDQVCNAKSGSSFDDNHWDRNNSELEKEENFDEDLDQLLLVVKDAIQEPEAASINLGKGSIYRKDNEYLKSETSVCDSKPSRFQLQQENLEPHKNYLEKSYHYQRYPKVEYESMVEEETIMETAVRSIQQKYLGKPQNSFFVAGSVGNTSTNSYLKRHHLHSSNSTNVEQITRILDLEKLARLPKLS